MAHFAVLSPPDAGHLIPLGALGRELVRRGHRITVVSPPKAAPLVRELNLPLYSLEADLHFTRWEGLLGLAFSTVGSGWVAGLRNWFRATADVTLEHVPRILVQLAVDGVLVDQAVPAGGTAAERCGLPFVTVCTAPPWNVDAAVPPSFTGWRYEASRRARLRNRLGYAGWQWFIRPTLRTINRARRDGSLRPFPQMEDAYSPLAQISQLFPELDYPREALPSCFHYVGALAADRPCNTDGFPWERLDGRPLIYASLGTVADPTNRAVYPRIAAACVGLDAQLVLVRGKWNEEQAGREASYDLPGNPVVVDYAPQLALLERAAVLITHAGLNTTLEGLSRGVPIVALPRSADQPANAARVAYAGAGLCASFYKATPKELRSILAQVLGEERFRRRARELQQALRAAGGAVRAAEIAEQALLTRQPVLRA
ncbi:MAG: glycosyltransferase [Planctomycetota bacterium]|nr:glycosyltransferase [Planctomycetota bacterium]